MNDERSVPVLGVITIGVAVLLVALGASLQQAAGRVRVVSAPTTWATRVAVVDQALAVNDPILAAVAWRDANVSARASGEWNGMVGVGDAYLRLRASRGDTREAAAKARESYLIALARARRSGDVDGVLRSAQAFAMLGDRELTARATGIAEHLATGRSDAAIHERVRRFAEAYGVRPVATSTLETR